MARGRGRPPESGFVIYLGRLRVRPGLDPQPLVDFARRWQETEDAAERQRLLVAAICGGWEGAEQAAAAEDAETAALLDDMLGGF